VEGDDIDDIDDLWEEVRPRPLGTALKVVPPPTPPPMPPSLLAELSAELSAEIYAKYDQRLVTSEMIADCILMGIRLYFKAKS
jgi:hypothetical protein